MGVEHPILIITKKSVEWFPSMAEAARVTGISRGRLARALDNPYGTVFGVRPPVCVDLPIRDATDEELEAYWKNAPATDREA